MRRANLRALGGLLWRPRLAGKPLNITSATRIARAVKEYRVITELGVYVVGLRRDQ